MMTRRFNAGGSLPVSKILLLILAVAAFNGCARLSKDRTAKVPNIPDTRVVEVKEDAETLQRIEAFSRFAVGVHHELNDNSKAATDEFLQAALSDLKNEDLVLDV